ncbi:glycosyltransferase family 1 protein [Streptomyces sp. TRM66268-LWL]|uniref:D-inositol 3-phosphate glycosyltransferase n=1 Tax=Streptomyces polyasparticus TaxID=2767826 RepID=A0ABR7SU93_9ACTN|nr:glycosyltransferase [Streptomyces polyasparticus]MBC9718167.1 glycosyltransferase family 1 protein [Streptomyces polyasparticus]
MTDILLIAAQRPGLAVLTDAVGALKERGATVRLAAAFDLDEDRAALERTGCDALHQLPRGFHGRSSVVRREAERRGPGEQLWLRAAHDRAFRALAREARLLVALDADAVYTVWRLARRHRAAGAVHGLAPAVQAMRTGAAASGAGRLRRTLPSPALLAGDLRRAVRRLPGTLVRAATVRRIMRHPAGARAWRTAVALPGLPARWRAPLARSAAEGMTWAGRPGGAALTLLGAARRTAAPELRAALLRESAFADLPTGRPPRALDEAVTAWLGLADRRLADGDRVEAATALHHALPLAFHRSVHIDQLTSPLAEDPAAYTRRLRDCRTFQAVTGTARGRAQQAAPPPADRPVRLLVLTNGNANFLGLVLRHYADRPDVELRFLDVAEHKELARLARSHWRIIADRLDARTWYREHTEKHLRPYLDWADTVFVDWCTGPVAMLTTIDPGTTRIVVRLHSYEAFTQWPLLADFSRVDELLFVAAHVRDLCTAYVPQLAGPSAPRMRLMHNAADLSSFERPKSPDARFTLGLVGLVQIAKDPLWALDVLDRVRAHDERYRLLLVGDPMSPLTSGAARNYRAALEERLAPLERAGAVERRGQTDDVPAALTDIGVILSSSVREGCHLAVLEGAASGAVPVVRDWPFAAGGVNGARTVYPEEWVVPDPDAAAERILRLTSDVDRWQAAGAAAAKHALSTWDWSVVWKDFDAALLRGGQLS